MLHHTRRMAGGCRLGERAGVSRFVSDLPAVACPGPVELRQAAGVLRFTPAYDRAAIFICAYRPFDTVGLTVSVALSGASSGTMTSLTAQSSGSGYSRIYAIAGLTPGVEMTVNWSSDNMAPESAVLVIDTKEAPQQFICRNSAVGGGLSGYSDPVTGPARGIVMGIANNMAIGALAPRVDNGQIVERCSQAIPLSTPAQPGEASIGLRFIADLDGDGRLGCSHNPTWGSQQADQIYTSYCNATFPLSADADINTTTTA